MDAMKKYNQLAHRATEQSPQQFWFEEEAPNLSSLYIFCQLGYVPEMSKKRNARSSIGIEGCW